MTWGELKKLVESTAGVNEDTEIEWIDITEMSTGIEARITDADTLIID